MMNTAVNEQLQLYGELNGVLPVLVAIVIAIIVVAAQAWRHTVRPQTAAQVAMILYVGVLVGITLFPVNLYSPSNVMSKLPFGLQGPYINVNLADVRNYTPVQVYGNVLLFMPLGFLAGLISKKYAQFAPNLALIVGTTFMIEAAQFIMCYFYLGNRTTDVVDLVTNTLGGIAGFLVLKLVQWLIPHAVARVQE